MATGISCFEEHSYVLTVATSNKEPLLLEGHIDTKNIQIGSKMDTDDSSPSSQWLDAWYFGIRVSRTLTWPNGRGGKNSLLG